VGSIMIRSPKTSLAYVPAGQFAGLLTEVAAESVKLSRDCVRLLPDPTFAQVEKWGIKVAVWVPQRILLQSGAPVNIE